MVATSLTRAPSSPAVSGTVTLFSSDPGFIWVWPAFFTAPASLLAVAVGGSVRGAEEVPAWTLVGALIGCALIQSFVLGALLEALRTSRRRRSARPHHS
ncbi:SCO4225 family membrane protein [Streptomyces sp. NPDC058620]|uniref:SCO4225 family membrane protein n=1 Tax=Streptomyces sp. NPDC058620 TaxID=3346560 RepID=UPI00364DC52A